MIYFLARLAFNIFLLITAILALFVFHFLIIEFPIQTTIFLILLIIGGITFEQIRDENIHNSKMNIFPKLNPSPQIKTVRNNLKKALEDYVLKMDMIGSTEEQIETDLLWLMIIIKYLFDLDE